MFVLPTRVHRSRAARHASGILLSLLWLVSVPDGARASNCAATSVGLTPITELGAALYQGQPGGLYPGAQNTRPAAHEASGLAQAAAIVPLNALGQPDPAHGRIVLLTIGMSNTSQESTWLVSLAAADPQKHPAVVVVNGAQGGQTAAIIADPSATFWTVVDSRLSNLGLTPLQVQAVWLKEANANPTQVFPLHAQTLSQQLRDIVRILRDRYPNTRLCYNSSRIYAGYANTTLNPEPYAYESAFAVRWMIEAQLSGDPTLNFDAAAGPVEAPWLAWGPYLWADGLTPRADGLTWQCAEFNPNDGTHPSQDGARKVGQLLLQFFKTDSTSAPWFLAAPTAAPVRNTAWALRLGEPRPNPFNPRVVLPFELDSAQSIRIEVLDLAGHSLRTLADRAFPPGAHSTTWDGRDAGGRPVASGVYWLRALGASGPAQARRVTLVR